MPNGEERLRARAVLLAVLGGLVGFHVRPAELRAQGVVSGESQIERGKALFEKEPCLQCHRLDGRGGTLGPDLSGEGTKGRSPAWLEDQIRDPKSHDPSTVMPAFGNLSDAERADLAAFLESLKGRPAAAPPAAAVAAPGVGGDLPLGGELYRLNCAPCHDVTARGGGLVGVGKNAPSLAGVPPAAIPAFIRAGPGPMPAFKEYVFSDKDVASVVLYVETLQTPAHPGGWGLGYFGTSGETLVTFLIGLVLAVLAALLIEWRGRG
jgi:ubiquinol-cytochrome c reductase cytochrome c subunit